MTTVRVAPNISETAGHFGHFLVMVAGSLVAKSLGGRLIVRIDWSMKTKGSLHDDASAAERDRRDAGFARIRRLAEYCGASEIIDEYGTRYALDGVDRPRLYQVLPGVRLPIAYDYDWQTLSGAGYQRFQASFDGPYGIAGPLASPELPLIAEHIHPNAVPSACAVGPTLVDMCRATGEPPRRFVKAHAHLEMDRLLGVTHVVRGNDFHSNRIRDVHERALREHTGVWLPKLCRVPTLTFDGEKISSSEEDGVRGIYPQSQEDVMKLLAAVTSAPFIDRFVPTLDESWFASLLDSDDPFLDAPFWKSNPLVLPAKLAPKMVTLP